MLWPQLLDAAIGIIDLLRSRKIRAMRDAQQQIEAGATAPNTHLHDVVSAKVREELERVHRERERIEEAERQRAELARKLELQRQAGDREIGRLRLVAGVALAGWIGTLLLAVLPGHVMRVGARVVLGFGWLLLLAGIAASFMAQSHVGETLDAIARDNERAARRGVSSGLSGAIAVWLVVAGLAVAGLAMLIP